MRGAAGDEIYSGKAPFARCVLVHDVKSPHFYLIDTRRASAVAGQLLFDPAVFLPIEMGILRLAIVAES